MMVFRGVAGKEADLRWDCKAKQNQVINELVKYSSPEQRGISVNE